MVLIPYMGIPVKKTGSGPFHIPKYIA